ncbi:MAG TPA: substrate-binding domain-containing protein, partial [Phototrophicaceae bacterium]|nr:substrate-binding domain-containing protein [Phototrophicaceae bacterium]
MMKSPKHTLVIVAFTTLVSCSSPGVPATMPDTPAQALRLFATSATLPLVTDLTGAYGDKQLTFETQSSNFQSALTSLLEGGETSYLFTTHLPPPETLTARLWAAPIGQDGIAVIVNPINTVTNLSLDQLREIYQGRVSNWQELGGQNSELVIFSREDTSDTRAEFERLVMGQRRTTLAAQLIVNSSGMIDAVANTPGGIGYVSLAFINQSNQRVQPLKIQGIEPTPAAILEDRYPLR